MAAFFRVKSNRYEKSKAIDTLRAIISKDDKSITSVVEDLYSKEHIHKNLNVFQQINKIRNYKKCEADIVSERFQFRNGITTAEALFSFTVLVQKCTFFYSWFIGSGTISPTMLVSFTHCSWFSLWCSYSLIVEI